MFSSTSLEHFDDGDEKGAEGFANLLGPGHVDHTVRQAISFCWMMLPKERKTLDNLETEVRRLFERALKDFRDDSATFGKVN
jgi:hypothetical protein